MDIDTAVAILKQLKPKERRVMYHAKDGCEITATHTGKISPKDFQGQLIELNDAIKVLTGWPYFAEGEEKNIAVGLRFPERAEFYPTHVRLLIDLHLKNLSNPQGAKILFCMMERVFNGNDPANYVAILDTISFPMQLDTADVNLFYAQLLMIEQDFNFGPCGTKKSKLKPPREFLMRFIRWVASGIDEIDKIITAAVRNYPPPVKFKVPIDCSAVQI